MANKVSLDFYLSFIGDGASATLTADVATAPFSLLQPATGTELSGAFTLATKVPTGISSIAISGAGGLGVTASILLGIVTFTFTGGVPTANASYQLHGTFTF